MKKQWIITIFIVYSVAAEVLLGSCSSAVKQESPTPSVLFEVEYLNYAWSYQQSGLYVDIAGNVYGYLRRKDQYWDGNDKTLFSYEELLNKFSVGKTLMKTIDAATLQQKIALGRQDIGQLTEPKYRCADAGTVSFWVYRVDTESGKYARTLLTRAGDVMQKNQTESGTALVNWLRSLDSAAYTQLPCFD